MSQRPMSGGPRGSRLSWLALRMAEEGIPQLAIQRCIEATDMPGAVAVILERAVADGRLPSLPPLDWPNGSRVTNRRPAREPVETEGILLVSQNLVAFFGFEPAGARLVAALMIHERLDTGSLRVIVQPKSQDAATLKVHACRARKRLARPDIGAEIVTIFGWGYWLRPPERDKIAKALTARRSLPDGVNVQFGGARPRASSRKSVGGDLAGEASADPVR